MSAAKVRIFYPADPAGVVPGGIDTFIRGMIKWAPPGLEFSLVGMTTDAARRPVGRWTRCQIAQRSFDFFPVVAVGDAGTRGRVPLSVRFMAGAARHRALLRDDFDVFDFHRVEPSLLYRADPRPKNAYFHQDPQSLRLGASDNLWRHLPRAYERIEARAVGHFTSAWCVRDSGVSALRSRYPALGERLRFMPTWVDTEQFFPVHGGARAALRLALAAQTGVAAAARWIVSVGRLDSQKDPQRLLAAFARLRAEHHDAVLLLIGDGVLRRELEALARAAGVADRVHFLGLKPAHEIADWLRAADVFALSSAYEGMPMALLEALGCGTPAVVTDVGEVRRVVMPGVNGAIVSEPGDEAFAAALAAALAAPLRWRAASVLAAQRYQPSAVLAPVYENHLDLARSVLQRRLGPPLQTAPILRDWPRSNVLAAPVDTLHGSALIERIAAWAEARDSRTACFCNVHSAVLASRDERHRLTLESADLVLADGAPIAWTLRRKGLRRPVRVDGPGTMLDLCRSAADRGIKVGLFGSTPDVLAALKQRLRAAYPDLDIAYVHAPPFRESTPDEDEAICAAVAASGIGMLFVGLGCPKQERWMAQHRGRVPAVMLGVGAAFDFHSGRTARAPGWMREHGLEWLHRLGSDPRRLGWRYVSTNSVFVASTFAEGVGRLARASRLPVRAGKRTGGDDWSQTVLEPLDNATPRRRRPKLDPHRVGTLAARIDACLPTGAAGVIGFIASGAREGTSTVARAYALACAAMFGRRVLLVSSRGATDARPGVIEALQSGLPLASVVTQRGRGVFVAPLGAVAAGDPAWNPLVRDELFDTMRRSFDVIVLDMPASDTSSAGFWLASSCDGVVVIVEAEKTRAPVASHLIANLRAVRATVIGTVLNKRRHVLPELIYRWL